MDNIWLISSNDLTQYVSQVAMSQSLSAIQRFTIAIVSALPFVGVVDPSVSELKL